MATPNPSSAVDDDEFISFSELQSRQSSNINIAPENSEVMDLPETLAESVRQHEEQAQQLARARRARTVVVPTSDIKVRKRLRELKEPMTLFGENIPGRRERLRAVLGRLILEGHTEAERIQAEEVQREKDDQTGGPVRDKAYLIEGNQDLWDMREFMASFSVPRAQQRLQKERAEVAAWRETAYSKYKEEQAVARPNTDLPFSEVEQQEAIDAHRLQQYRSVKKNVQGFYNSSSEVGDVRPVCSVDFSPDSAYLVTGSWSGQCKIWDAVTLRQLCRLREQPERITDVAWHSKSPHIATGCVDGVVRLFPTGSYDSKSSKTEENGFVRTDQDFTHLAPELRVGASSMQDDTPVSVSAEAIMTSERSRQALFPEVTASLELKGHEDRLAKIAFHPAGKHLGSASFDYTWKLWDLEKETAVLTQPGHIRPVYTLSFQEDGSIVYSGDLGGSGHLWDLRTGRTLDALEGHSKQVLCSSFHPNGWLLATGSGDNTVRIWDLRRRRCLYTIPGHTNMVSSVHWLPDSGQLTDGGYFITSSFDRTMKVWSSLDCSLLTTLIGHESRIMQAKIAPDSQSFVSCSYDRTFKIWAPTLEF